MKTIITALDDSDLSTLVAQAGLHLAQASQGKLVLLHVLEKEAPAPSDLSGAIGLGARSSLRQQLSNEDEEQAKKALHLGKEILANTKAQLEQQASTLASAPSKISTLLRHGELLENLEELEADLNVLGVKGKNCERAQKALGNHIEALISKSPKPLLLVKANFKAPQAFILATDLSKAERLESVLATLPLTIFTCHLLAVAEDTPQNQAELAKRQALLETAGYQVQAHLLPKLNVEEFHTQSSKPLSNEESKKLGSIGRALALYQEQAQTDFIVMGTSRQPSLLRFFLGSPTLKVLHHLELSLLVLP